MFDSARYGSLHAALFIVLFGISPRMSPALLAQGPTAIPSAGGPPVYSFAELPKQMFSNGKTLLISLQDNPVAKYSVTADPKPEGNLGINAQGLLTFSPSRRDAGNFKLTLVKRDPSGASSQRDVTVSLFANLAPEYTLVSKSREKPPEESSQYILTTESEGPQHRLFNNLADRKVMDIVVSGKTIILDAKSDKNQLMQRFKNRTDIESITIYAQTLLVRSRVEVPGADVHVYARELRFDDGTEPVGTAAIVTTPLTNTILPGTGQSGLPGQNGGSISIAVQHFTPPPGNSPRFIVLGADGQQAGPGQNGAPGSSLPCFKNINLGGTCVVHMHQFAGPTSFGPDNTWPGNGLDATKPGAPGNGGMSGSFSTNVVGWAPFVQSGEGHSGAMAKHVDGGPAGQPTHALNIEMREHNNHGLAAGPCPDARFQIPCTFPPPFPQQQMFAVESTHDSISGQGFDPPPPPTIAHVAAQISLGGTPDDWLQPPLIRAVLNHAEDAYLEGALDYTTSVLADFGALLDTKIAQWDADEQVRNARNQGALAHAAVSAIPALQKQIDREDNQHNSLMQLQLEIAAISTRISNNLDYFGHPAGWVPQLSLAYTLQSYSNEVKNDIPLLYLAYYVQYSSADRERHLNSLVEAQSQLQSDVASLTEKVNNTEAVMIELQQNADLVNADINLQQVNINNRLITLTQQAQDNVDARNSVPFWKTSLKVLSVAATVCPVGQPMVGAVGIGLGVLSNAGQQGIVETGQQLGNIAEDFSKDKIKQSVDNYHQQIATLDPGNAKNAVQYVKGLAPMAKAAAKEYQAINASLQTHKASSEEVDKELAQLEGSDSEFTQFSDSVRELNTRKKLFDEQLGVALNETSQSLSSIQSDWQALDVTSRTIDDFAAALDHEAVQQVQVFGRRTRDRLLLYQYYLAKAYEYRLLNAYPGDFHLDRLLDALVKMASPTQEHDQSFKRLSPQDFDILSQIYTESIQEVITAANSKFQEHGKPQQAVFPVNLSADQLKILNEKGQYTLDLGDAIGHLLREDNRRLVDIDVVAKLDTPEGAAGTPIKLTFEHSGASVLHSESKSYLFVHSATDNDAPYIWGGTLESNNQWDKDVISPEYIETLKQLQRQGRSGNQSDIDINGLFALPGLEGPVLIRRQLGIGERITSLRLDIKYVHDNAAKIEYPVDVRALDGLQPIINVDAYDNAGRTLGQGSFTRYYPENANVVLSAPPTYGGRAFSAWIVDGVVSGSPNVTLKMDTTHLAQVRYAAHP